MSLAVAQLDGREVDSNTTDFTGRVRTLTAGQTAVWSAGAVEVGSQAAPSAPTNLTATSVSSSQIKLAWTDTSNNETGFRIERKTGSTGTYSLVTMVGAGVTTYQDIGRSPGTTYFYQVLSTNGAGNSAPSASASATTQTAPEPTGTVKVNFQTPTSVTPGGYLADAGAAFGSRGNNYSYGWNADVSAATRDRNHTRSPDQRYDTQILTQKDGANSTWEIGVANGTYSVHLVAGDPSAFDSYYLYNIEGTLALEGDADSSTYWIENTVNVTVSDGRLTLGNAIGASNNKICFVDITRL